MSWNLFFSLWSWDPSVILGSAALIAGYLAAVHFRITRKAVFFIAGVFVLFIALESPLEHLGDTYLFSAHMLQHLLLLLIVPPLLLMGLPEQLMQRVLDWPLADRIEKVVSHPVLAWFLANITLWLWHWPVLYNATLANEQIHIIEHLSFLVTATIFWWPVLAPIEERRMAPLAVIPYTFAAAVSNSILGILLTYAKPGLYPAYLNPVDEFGALKLIRDVWGITPKVDQELGGLAMWVPGSLVYLFAAMGGMSRWYSTPEEGFEESQKGEEQEQLIHSSSLEEA